VGEPRRRVERSNARHQWEKDRARLPEAERRSTGATERDTGLTKPTLVFHAEYRPAEADKDLAAAFGLPVGTRLLERIYRTRYVGEDVPFNLTHSYLVHDQVAVNPDLLDPANEPWPGGTQSQLHTIGIELDRVVERVTARPPTDEEARELGMSGCLAVLALRKTCLDVRGRTVEVSDIRLPGDRTELVFATPLARW
jgi:Transcriptional regulators